VTVFLYPDPALRSLKNTDSRQFLKIMGKMEEFVYFITDYDTLDVMEQITAQLDGRCVIWKTRFPF